jgi:biotin operon repressor
MTLKLTNYKEKLLPNGKTAAHKPHLISQFDPTDSFKPKFDKLFQPEGHTYTTSFDNIMLEYVLAFDIISLADAGVYELLLKFCKKDIAFSLEILAKRLHMSKDTLRTHIDNLENAGLLEVVKVNDEAGQHNCYLLKTPLFTAAQIRFDNTKKPNSQENLYARNFRRRILDEGGQIPEVCLDDVADKLKRAVRKNAVRKARMFLSDKANATKHSTLYGFIKQDRDSRQFVWKEISHTFGHLAGQFENYIRSIVHQVANIPYAKNEFRDAVKRFVQTFCNDTGLQFSKWFTDKAIKLIEFFKVRWNVGKAKKAEENLYQTEAVGENDSEVVENEEFADIDYTQITAETRQRIKQIVDNGRHWTKTIQEIVQKFRNLPLPTEIVKQIVNEFVPAQYRDKIFVELRT